MNKELLDARRAASRGATVGGTVLYVVTALAIACELLHGLMLLGPKLPGTWGDPVFNALLATSQVIAIITMALLGRFLRHFATDAAPFRTAQSSRLVVVTALIAGRVLLNAALRCAYGTAGLAAIPALSGLLGAQAALGLVALGTFLACLSMVVRYGNALQEDSDSIV